MKMTNILDYVIFTVYGDAAKAGILSLYIPGRPPQTDAMDLANFHLPSLADYPRDK